MSASRQALHFELARSGQLSAKEIGVLQYIITYSEYCSPKRLKDMAERLQMSDRTLRRLLDGLIAKGLIWRVYTIHKRVVLRVVTLAAQAKLMGIGMVRAVVRNASKLHKKRSHRSPVASDHRSPMTESIKNKDKENKTILGGVLKTLMPEGRRDPHSEVQRFLAHLAEKQQAAANLL